MDEASARKQYVKDKQVHHLFELLAAKTLAHRPENIYAFLREQLTKIEEGESKAHTYDPTKVQYGSDGSNRENASSSPAAAGSPPSGSPVTPGQQLKVNLSIFGLNNAGKTAIVAAMGGNVDKKTTPTVGFSPMHFETDDFQLVIFDLGGAKNFRGIWQHYYADCHGYIYVVDASDPDRMQESIAAFQDMIAHRYVQGKPILVFANKKDVTGALTTEKISQLLNLKSVPGATKVVASCAIDEAELGGVEEGVEWMLSHIKDAYPKLQKVIDSHATEVKIEKQKRLEEQRKRVDEDRARREADAAKGGK